MDQNLFNILVRACLWHVYKEIEAVQAVVDPDLVVAARYLVRTHVVHCFTVGDFKALQTNVHRCFILETY